MVVSKKDCPYCHFKDEYEDPMATLFKDGCELFIRKDNSLEMSLYGDDDDIYIKFDEKIRFCPMCGRKLGSES